MHNRSVLRRYMRDVRNALAGSGKMKRSILSHLRKSVEDYLSQNPNADPEAIRSRFGTPQQIAASCMDGQEGFALMKKVSIRKKMLFVTAAAMAVVLVYVGHVAWNVQSSLEDSQNAVQHIKVEIEYH